MIVEIDDGDVTVSADIFAGHFGIDPKDVQPLMRAGEITGRVEKGAGEDEGRYRLTFWHAGRQVRLTCDAAGRVINTSRTILAGRTRVLP